MGLNSTPSNPFVAVVIAAVLFAVSWPIIQRMARAEKSTWLARVLTISLILHLLAAPLQIFIVNHFYSGIADWLRYDHQGSLLAPNFRHFNFTLANANVRGVVGDGSVSIAAGIVFAIIGTNQLGAFLVFSWLSFIGLTFFYRAFTVTFAGSSSRRYAILLFFLPSMIFWTADVSKEAVMTLALGVATYGAARILARQRGGFPLVIIGGTLGALVRPNELLLLMGGLAAALMILPPVNRNLGGLRRLVSLVVLSAMLITSLYLTQHYLHGSGGSFSLNQVAQNNQSGASAAGHGSSVVGYSSSPGAYPKDVYTVLFDPLPFNAHGGSQRLAALENTILIVVLFLSWRQLRIFGRAVLARPYILLCTIYSAGFLYAFAALANLGLITRERALLFPFLLVPLSIPVTPRGRPPRFDWELRRRARARRTPGSDRRAPVPAARRRRDVPRVRPRV